jgi:hypothetical protein
MLFSTSRYSSIVSNLSPIMQPNLSILIIKLTFHDLIMEIVQNSFIHNWYISCTIWKHIWNKSFFKDTKFVWHSFIHRFILHSSTHLFVCQMCFQLMVFVHKMYEFMNEQISHKFHY